MNPFKLIGWVFVGLLLVGGAVWWNRHQDSQHAADLALWKQKLHVSDSSLAVASLQRDSATAANRASIPVYIQGRDRIIHDAAGTPAAPAVKACFELADQRISKCEASRKADSVVINAQQDKIKVLESKPEPQAKRFQFYGAVGYSVRFDSAGTQAAPAFRTGVESRLIGPVSLTIDAQLSMPGKGHSTPLTQVTPMLRVNF